ncbi:cytochrome P450 CYP12A2-like isoform X2 [Hyposmocoma kahamanoa]|nr:cytochrome P450 CYP12A2-like isoform X2 [Hyposmocoma kahamanoa]XP_026329293.1 cytochrome P450 CYP12A2-like isoform X2 [Hyposmocoma kahamanoa]XP_026329294.1 cytochrome P450 CYP12A2-like isoform X2 [Hyposmocoma kahamanoa]XP_026329295.1 cytochrome P450 CYP12A2-like isoform X2 [Hyposmocoma kahamanoa]
MRILNYLNHKSLLVITQNVKSLKKRTLSTALEQPKPYSAIPGLGPLPIIGGLHHFLPVIGKIGLPENFAAMTGKLHKEYGPIVRVERLFPNIADMVMLFEPDHFDQVYRAEDVLPMRPGFKSFTYYREEFRKERFEGVYGLTTAQGPQWRDFRTKVNPALLKPKLVKLYAPGLDNIAEEMVARLIKLSADKTYLRNNFDAEMKKFALESVALVCLGARLGALEDNLTEDHPAEQLRICSKELFDLGFKYELMPKLLQKFNTRMFNRLMKLLDTQWDISAKYIEQAKQRIKERGHNIPEEDKSVLEKLLAVDEKVAIMMANEMLMAGIDTVALATTVLLYRLATNPKVQDKLREEIRSDDTNKRYLKACLKESLRMNAVISANLRMTTREHIVGGYVIPKGVDVIAPNEYLSRLDKYYPRASEFIPERWLTEKTDPLYYGNAHPMITQPFGFGIRSCIGRRIAELEIEIFVQRLINDLKVSWDGPPMKIVTNVMNNIKKPYCFKFEQVK